MTYEIYGLWRAKNVQTSDKISADKNGQISSWCRKFFPSKNFVRRNFWQPSSDVLPCTSLLRFLQVFCSSKFPCTTFLVNCVTTLPFGLYLATTKVHHSSSFFATARPKPRCVVSFHTTCKWGEYLVFFRKIWRLIIQVWTLKVSRWKISQSSFIWRRFLPHYLGAVRGNVRLFIRVT